MDQYCQSKSTKLTIKYNLNNYLRNISSRFGIIILKLLKWVHSLAERQPGMFLEEQM